MNELDDKTSTTACKLLNLRIASWSAWPWMLRNGAWIKMSSPQRVSLSRWFPSSTDLRPWTASSWKVRKSQTGLPSWLSSKQGAAVLQNRVLSLGYLGDENQHLCMFMDVYKDLYSTMMYYFFEMNTQLPAILGRTLIRSKATSSIILHQFWRQKSFQHLPGAKNWRLSFNVSKRRKTDEMLKYLGASRSPVSVQDSPIENWSIWQAECDSVLKSQEQEP